MKKIFLTLILLITLYGVAVTQINRSQDSLLDKLAAPIEVVFKGDKKVVSDTLLLNDSITILTLDDVSKQERNITEEIDRFFKNFKGNYQMQCAYPDGSQLDAMGQLAIRDGYYYDSNNVQFVLLNKEWMISADHISKHLVLLDLNQVGEEHASAAKRVNQQLTKLLQTKETQLEIVEENDRQMRMRYDLKNKDRIDVLTVVYDKEKHVVQEASLRAKFPLESNPNAWEYIDESEHSRKEYIKVDFKYNQLEYDVDEAFFSEKRILYKKGKKIGLNRFIGYKILNKI